MRLMFVALILIFAAHPTPALAQADSRWAICLDELQNSSEMTITRPFSIAAQPDTGIDPNLSLALKSTELWRDHHPHAGSNGTICQVGTKQEVEAAFDKFKADPLKSIKVEEWIADPKDMAPSKLTAFRGFASCFIALRPNEGKGVTYLTSSFPSSRYEASDQQKYIDAFVKFLATKYPPNGNGTAQAGCNFSTSASEAEQMSDSLLRAVGMDLQSAVRTGWHP